MTPREPRMFLLPTFPYLINFHQLLIRREAHLLSLSVHSLMGMKGAATRDAFRDEATHRCTPPFIAALTFHGSYSTGEMECSGNMFRISCTFNSFRMSSAGFAGPWGED